MAKYVKSADTQLLVSKVKEVGKRKELDKVKLLNLSVSIAQSKSSTALEGIGTILSDNIVTPTEKKQLELTREQLTSAYAILISEAGEYQQLDTWTTEQKQALQAYKTAYSVFLSELDKILTDSGKNTTVNRQTFITLARTYYDNQKSLDVMLQMFRYGIDKIKYWYLLTHEYTKPASTEFSKTEPQELTDYWKYQWRKEVIYYTNGKTQEQIELIGTYGDKGDTGDGITEIVNWYLASDQETGITTETAGWSKDLSTQKIDKNKPFLWDYEEVKYTIRKPQTTTPSVMARYTENGTDGVSITEVIEKYARSESNTEEPADSSFTDKPADCPLTPILRFLWNYEIIKFSNGTEQPTKKVVIGVYGDKGDTGDRGNGISDIVNYYLATSLTKVTTETTGWNTDPTTQKLGESALYLWNYEKIVYTDTSVTPKTTEPAIIGTYSKDGQKGEDGVSISDVVEYYGTSNDSSVKPTEYYTDPNQCPLGPSARYLWNYEVISFSKDKNPITTQTKIIGVYGEKGDKGDGFTLQYNYSLSETEPDIGTGDCYYGTDLMLWGTDTVVWMDWQDKAPEEREGYFIWIRIKLASGEWQYTRLTGKVGQGLAASIQQYCLSSSDTISPENDDAGWTSIKPDLVSGKFLWTRLQNIWQNPYKVTYSIANLGDKVLLSANYYYLATSENKTPDSLSFTDTGIPLDWNKDKPYLWEMVYYNYANGATEYKITLYQTYHELYITASPTSYTYDKRSEEVRTIQFKAEYCGYTNGTIEWVLVSGGGTINNGLYTFPTNGYPASITVRATLSVDSVKREEATLEVFGTDVTEYEKFLGYAEETPSEKVLEGDYYVKSDGYAKEYKNGQWVNMDTVSDSDKMLNALNKLLEQGVNLSQLNNPNTVYWFNNIVAQTITAETIKGIKGIFEGIAVTGKSQLSGTITNDVFETFQEDEKTETYTASGGSLSEGNSNTIIAKGVLGKSVKTNVSQRAKTLTSLAVNTASGKLLGYDNFDKMVYISSVSSEAKTAYSATGTELKKVTYSYTNPYPCPIKYYLDITAETISREEEITDVTAVLKGSFTQLESSSKPSYHEGDYTPWPDKSDIGKTYYENRDITLHEQMTAKIESVEEKRTREQLEEGYSSGYSQPMAGVKFTKTTLISSEYQYNNFWLYTYQIKNYIWVDTSYYTYWRGIYEYEGNTHTETVNYSGSEKVTNNGATVDPYSYGLGKSITVVSGATLSITLDVPSETGSVVSYGSVSISWKSAENFNAGVAFFKNGSLSFYLSSLSDGIHTSDVSLIVNGTTWLNLPLESSTAWTYSSSYGAIYKLVKFYWAKGPSSASIVKADDCLVSASAEYYDMNHAKKAPTSITDVSMTPTSISASGTGTAVLLDTSTYINYFSVSVTIKTKTKGVYAYNLMPLVDKKYSLGDSQHRWQSLRLNDWMLQQDSSGNLEFSRT